MPMPLDGGDCLCPDCLRKAAAARRERGRDVTDIWDVRAVLLDMDGTLLDTERVYFDSLVTALGAFGYTDDVETLCHAMVGLPGPDCEAMLHARYGETFPLADVNKAFIARRDEMSRGRPAAEKWRHRIARCAAGKRMPDGDRDLVVAAHGGCAFDAGRHPQPFRHHPDPRRRRARQAEPGSVSAGGVAGSA